MTYINMQTDVMNTPKKKCWASSQMATDSLKALFFSPQLYINATLTCLNGDFRKNEKKKNIDH